MQDKWQRSNKYHRLQRAPNGLSSDGKQEIRVSGCQIRCVHLKWISVLSAFFPCRIRKPIKLSMRDYHESAMFEDAI